MDFSCVFAVKDVHASRAFYQELFDLKVSQDYGLMLGFSCGLVLQQDFDRIIGVPKAEMKNKENNCEVYFERRDFDAFIERLRGRSCVEYLHEVKEVSWGQRSIKFYDPDAHLIEVGESLKAVVGRFMEQGMNEEETAKRMDIAVSDVRNILNEA